MRAELVGADCRNSARHYFRHKYDSRLSWPLTLSISVRFRYRLGTLFETVSRMRPDLVYRILATYQHLSHVHTPARMTIYFRYL